MKLQEYIEKYGTTKTLIAKRAGISPNTIGRMMRGEEVTFSVVLRLHDVLNGEVDFRDMAPDKYLLYKQAKENSAKKQNKSSKKKKDQ